MSATFTDIPGPIEEYIPMVSAVARQVLRTMPGDVLFDDLYQDGMIGLCDAVNGYDETQGLFSTYAAHRVRGSIVDGLRATDWASRGIRRVTRKINKVEERLAQELLRKPSEKEVADELDITLGEFQATLRDAMSSVMTRLPEFFADDRDAQIGGMDPSPYGVDTMIEKERHEKLIDAIAGLSLRERHVMTYYYQHDWSFGEIGLHFGFTESRACQIHGACIRKLRIALEDWGALSPQVKLIAMKRQRAERAERHAQLDPRFQFIAKGADEEVDSAARRLTPSP